MNKQLYYLKGRDYLVFPKNLYHIYNLENHSIHQDTFQENLLTFWYLNLVFRLFFLGLSHKKQQYHLRIKNVGAFHQKSMEDVLMIYFYYLSFE